MSVQRIVDVAALCLACLVRCAEVCALDDASQPIIDEVVAGVEANVALIQHGTASYAVRSRLRENAAPSSAARDVTQNGTVRAYFNYPKMYFEWTGTGRVAGTTVTVREIFDGGSYFRFLVPWSWPPERVPGDACAVFIKPASRQPVSYLHPREQLHLSWGQPPTFAEQLRDMERNGKLSAVRQGDGHIRIAYESPGGANRADFWVSPREGYCLVRAEEWFEWSAGAAPEQVYEASARAVGGGAFVLARREETIYTITQSGERRPDREDESRLLEIDLSVTPDAELFTIDGLGLRSGARIFDKVHGRQYRYGVDAPDEGAIEIPRVGGPMRLRYWFIGVNLTLGGIAVAWLIRRSKRGRRVSERLTAVGSRSAPWERRTQ